MTAPELAPRAVPQDDPTSSRFILAFGLAHAVFILGPALLSFPLAAGPIPSAGDLLDLPAPFVLIALYYVMFRRTTAGAAAASSLLPARLAGIAFVLSAVLFAQGQGMHLTANSVGHFLKDSKGTDAEAITYFYDEVLGHYLWHAGTIVLAAVISLVGIRAAAGASRQRVHEDAPRAALLIAALVYGLTFSLAVIEGQIVPLGLPASLLLVALVQVCRWRQDVVATSPAIFFGIAHGFAALLMLGWGLYFRGWPEFSALGLLG